MIYGVSRNGKKCLGYSGSSKPIDETLVVIPKPLSEHFVPSGTELKCSKQDSSSYSKSQSQTQKKKNSEPKYRAQIPYDYHVVQNSKGVKTSGNANKKGPRKWVPKDKIIYVADILHGVTETPIMVPGQWMLATHDGRKAYVPRFGT